MDKQGGSAGRENEGDILANNPRAINVAEFASARAAELKTMTEAVMTMGGMRRTFQRLPRHMRRRAMSHDLRRLPKRLRDSEERAMHKSTTKKKSGQGKEGGTDEETAPAKRSRRHRRRPGNLRQEYQRRQRNHIWLETHIWHAKRFKMAELWGHRIALHPSDKSARATYRAMARHCLLQDISYLKVIEISGPQWMILKALSHLTSPLTGLTCAAASYLGGLRHGETTFYENDRFPEGALGLVNFLWKAVGSSTDSSSEVKGETRKEGREKVSSSPGGKYEEHSVRQLWLWAHPSCSSALLEELRAACQADKKVTDGRVRVRQLEDSPLRFRLQGPLSHPVLQDALKAADVSITSGSDKARMWWEVYYTKPDQMQAQMEQSSAWKTLRGVLTAADLPPRCVLGLTVRDPRNLLPIKKLKIMADPDEFVHADHLAADVLRHLSLALSVSPIWEESVRQSVTSTQIPIYKLNRMRSELLVPGQELSLGRQESRIPVLLLQQPGTTNSAAGMTTASYNSKQQGMLGFGSGWDIVIPSGWGMAFWIALIFRGARAAGLEQSRSCHLQRGLLHFPEAYPDTMPGQEWEDKVEQELTKKFQRWPPAKRPNYGKLGVVSPFRCPWTKLLEEWRDAKKEEMEEDEDEDAAASSIGIATNQASDTSSSFKANPPAGEVVGENHIFFVLRERSKLEKLSETLVANHRPPNVAKTAKVTNQIGPFGAAGGNMGINMNKTGERTEASNGHAAYSAPDVLSKESQTGHHKLSPSGAAATLHQNADRTLVGVKLRLVNRGVPHPFAMICLPTDDDLTAFKSNQRYSPVEPIHQEFKLQRASKKKKKKGKKSKSSDENPRELSNKVGVKFEVAPDVKLFDSCIRRVIGFITDGANTFISGSGQAVGYCCMLGLLTLVEERPRGQSAVVLIRDTKTVQYRFAYMDVIM